MDRPPHHPAREPIFKLTPAGKWVWVQGTYSEERMPQRDVSADASGQMAAYTGGIGAGSDADLDMNLEYGWPYPMDIPPELDDADLGGPSAWHMVPATTTVATTQNADFVQPTTMEQPFSYALGGLHHCPQTEQDLAPRELTSVALVGYEQPGPAAVGNVQDWLPMTTGYRYTTSPDAQTVHTISNGSSHRDRNVSRRAQGVGGNLPALSGVVSYRSTNELDGVSEWSMVSRPRSG